MYITCPNCRQQIEDTEAKCPYCNTEINEENPGMVSGRNIEDYKDMPEEIRLMYGFSKRRKIKLYLEVSYVASILLAVPLMLILFGYPAAVGLFVILSIAFLIIASETKCFRCPFCDRMTPGYHVPPYFNIPRSAELLAGAAHSVKSAIKDDQCPFCNGRSL